MDGDLEVEWGQHLYWIYVGGLPLFKSVLLFIFSSPLLAPTFERFSANFDIVPIQVLTISRS